MKKLILILIISLPLWAASQVRWEQIKPISAQVELTTPAADDIVLIQDISDSNARKYITVANLVSDSTKLDSVGYTDLKTELTGRIADSDGTIDFSASGVVTASFSADTTAITFSNLQQNKVVKIKLTLSSSGRVTWPSTQVYGDTQEDGTFWVWVDSWGTTTSDLVITLRKSL